MKTYFKYFHYDILTSADDIYTPLAISVHNHGRIQRGGQGVRTPLKNNKNTEFLSKNSK